RRMWMLVHRRLDLLAELDLAFDAPAVREHERENARVLVPFAPHPHHRPVALVVEQPSVLVDEPEAPVAAHAAALEHDLVRVLKPERLHRRNRDPNNVRLHAEDRSRATWLRGSRLRHGQGRRRSPAGPASTEPN